ncbi:hypothetical protein B0T21DRAFT_449874 [Apiosordaria backusii]|uniref:F-box domain-containing protein n=1 Tax=Apiosordaria backusii TaxID=314023 RepID=A0AA40BSX9_9PEZI|nr:hypothetical protein B0T21DRAFT_449874 [Apiosordaria backusii]
MGFFSRKKNKNKSSDLGGGAHYDPRLTAHSSNDYNATAPRSNLNSNYDPRDYQLSGHGFRSMATGHSPQLIARLPEGVLRKIFGFVCPHARDESYESFEASSLAGGEERCMLCDMRDLAHCVAVNRRWRGEGSGGSLFYEVETPVSHAEGGSGEKGALVQYLKMPYMLREAAQADLARTIAVTPQLRYVDLPEGLFTDEPNFVTLRLEVQARCLELRKMSYMRGSENSLQALATGRVWTKLEVLELNRIGMDGGMLRLVLGGLSQLKALKMSEMEGVGDEVFSSGWEEQLPPFPGTIEELILTDCKNITSEGLRAWLSSSSESRERLRVLTLNNTGVRVWGLHSIIGLARGLKHLSIVEKVTVALPSSHDLQPLRSTSLETLRYEITSASSSTKKYGSPSGASGITASYYSYLASSLLSGGLPNLRSAYVRDTNFPDLLLGLPPLPMPAFAEGAAARPGSSSSLSAFGSSPTNKPHNFGGLPPLQPGSLPNTNPFFAPGHNRQQGSLNSLNIPFGGGAGQQINQNRFSSNNPFAQAQAAAAGFMNLPSKLEVFTKSESDDQLNWNFVKIGGGVGGGARGASQHNKGERPLSSYGLGADIIGDPGGWSSGAGARRSVLVSGQGAQGGAFLAVPTEMGSRRGRQQQQQQEEEEEEEWPRPRTANGESKRERLDLWR